MSDAVRVRFAPSPTGTLHLGGARTAIYNWAFARRNNGAFILRIDDTDRERSTPENTAQILRSLRWLGLDWDEGPEVGGEHGPYFQTERHGHYVRALDAMRTSRAAYPCFCSAAELEAKREAARANGVSMGYDRTCRTLDAAEVASRLDAGTPCVWRLAVPLERGPVVVEDEVRGTLEFPIEAMDDFVLARSDGSPTYNFASVVDDAEMAISHVIRGDDHLTNTPRQVLVFEALGMAVPRFAHLSMIWGPDGKKLSKRHGATSVEAYQEQGYLPEALLNYLALLGWSLDGETTVVPPEVLTANFSLERVSKNPAIFDPEKLSWLNGTYLRDLDPDEFIARMLPWLERSELAIAADFTSRPDWYRALVPLISERVRHLDEVADKVAFFFTEPSIDDAALSKVLAKEGARAALEGARAALDRVVWNAAAIEAALREVPESIGAKPKDVFQTIRVAVSGSTVSPPLFESLELLGRDTVLARIDGAVALTER